MPEAAVTRTAISDQLISELAEQFSGHAHDALATLAATGEITRLALRDTQHLYRVNPRSDTGTLFKYVYEHGVRPSVDGWNR